MEWFCKLHKRVVDGYVDGGPLHAKRPQESIFYIIHIDKFNALSAPEVQAIFSVRHILVYGLPDRKLDFDENGLNTLAHLNKMFTIQGK